MKVKDIIAELLTLNQEKSLVISVDVSVNDFDTTRRAFADELLGSQDNGAYYTLLLSGALNKQ